ncbi:MAG: urea ABC transporter ATP-binding protein UrtD [Lachnospiraceae bacterium]|nr:urea ABC transporter ATP-binding protein UrtD [Lachnospiraceae bacterium]
MMGEDYFLLIKELCVQFGTFVAVDHVNLAVKNGETRVIIGPNGAGKTTLLDLITGKTKATSGTIEFNGHQLIGKSTSHICRNYCVGRKFQGPNVFGELTVQENMKLALMGGKSFFQCLFQKNTSEEENRIRRALEAVNLLEYEGIRAASLSHGQKQWLEIGMVILQDAQLVVLDEPTAGMTAEETYKTGEMIKKNLADKTVLVIEHDMDFVRQIAETVTVLHHGKVLAEGTFEEVENNPKVVQVYLKQEEEA